MGKPIIVSRTGDKPLSFEGEQIVSYSSRTATGDLQSRWHEVTVYRNGEGYVVSICYRAEIQGEHGHDIAQACKNTSEVVSVLRDYDPIAHVAGYPTDAEYDARQDRLEDQIEFAWEDLIHRVLASEGLAATR
jgi:hypothetical protein